MRFSWRDEFIRWVPYCNKHTVNVILNGKAQLFPTGRTNVVIISYDLVAKLRSRLKQQGFKVRPPFSPSHSAASVLMLCLGSHTLNPLCVNPLRRPGVGSDL